MRYALAVRFVQSIGNLDGVLQHLIERQRAFHESLGQRLALDILHHEVISAVLMSDVIKRADVRMIQTWQSSKPRARIVSQFGTVSKMRGQNLDGDDAVEAGIFGAVNLTPSARTTAESTSQGPDVCR